MRDVQMLKPTMLAVLLISLVVSPVGQVVHVSAKPQLATGVPQDPSVVGYLNLHKRHPDGEAGPLEFSNAYSSEQALERLTQMRGFLDSFRQLTERARSRLSRAELQGAGNTSGEMQTIGFHNIPLVVEGVVLKQDYQLRQVQYELAQLKRSRGEITSQELDRARTAYENATANFQTFWDTKLPTD